MRNVIMPPILLFLVAILSALILGAEYGCASERDGGRVVASSAHCVGKSLAAGVTLSLSLTCDSTRSASTSDAATIKRYAEAPTTRLRCTVYRSGRADCAPAKSAAH